MIACEFDTNCYMEDLLVENSVDHLMEHEFWEEKDMELDIIVNSSQSFADQKEVELSGLHYEERQLVNIFLLKDRPLLRIIYLTSLPIAECVIDYYISLIVDEEEEKRALKRRIFCITVDDPSIRPLSEKILERNQIIEQIKGIMKPKKTALLCYATTGLEVKLANRLGVPLLGNGPGYATYGSKSGSRAIFKEARVPFPVGVHLVFDATLLSEAIAELLRSHPSIRKFVVKLDQGFSGNGNAILSIPPTATTVEDIVHQMSSMKITSNISSWDCFRQNMTRFGVVAEAFLEGEVSCPSIQGFITPKGKVLILSTHDQVLDGQEYLGCKFPANASYREDLHRYGKAVGEILAQKGQRGFFGLDCMVSSKDNSSIIDNADSLCNQIYALEINLRQTGTTHPYFAFQLLTGARYDPSSSSCVDSNGNPKYYFHSDNIIHTGAKGKLSKDLVSLIKQKNLGFNKDTKCGYVFYMFNGVKDYTQISATCIANSPMEAEKMMKTLEAVLEECWPSPVVGVPAQ